MLSKPGVQLKKASFGSCEYVRTSPPAENFVESGKAVNVHLTFEEALKLKSVAELVKILGNKDAMRTQQEKLRVAQEQHEKEMRQAEERAAAQAKAAEDAMMARLCASGALDAAHCR